MPEDVYMKKYETTCVYESPSLINDYNRSELKKEGPIQGFFESDQKRTNYDTKGRLALREHGKRRATEPWLPDGTFLDHQFATKDSRSIMYQPDMRKHTEQQYARAGYYNFRSDEDYSIPESMIHPEAYRQKIRETQPQAKARMNIFETSQVGWHNGGATQALLTAPHAVDSTVRDSEVSTVSNFTLENRTGKTNTLSNDTSIGWRKSVDHRFKVAHYGQQRGALNISEQDFYKNRGSTKYDQEVTYLLIEESPVPRPTAEMIIDLSAKRLMEIEGASHVKLGISKKSKVMKRKLAQHDMIRAQAKFINPSQKDAAHTKLDGMQGNKPGEKFQGDDTLQRYTVVKPKIVEKISLINKLMASRERDDLRNEIEQTAKDGGIYIKGSNASRVRSETLDPANGKYNVLYDFKRGSEKTVHVYGKGKTQKKGTDASRVSFEDFASESFESEQRRRNLDPTKLQQKTDHVYDTEIPDFTPNHSSKKGGMNKSRTKYMNVKDHAMNDDTLMEMTSGLRR
jgi:hypothetical protein